MKLINFQNTEIAFAYKNQNELERTWLLFKAMQYNWLVKIGPTIVNAALKLNLPIRPLLKKFFFDQFCGGTSLSDLDKSIRTLSQFGVQTLLDYSVEGEKTEKGFDSCKEELLKTVEYAHKRNEVFASALKVTGLGAFSILEKWQKNQLSDSEFEKFNAIEDRLDEICKKAYDLEQSVYIDAEESWIQDTIDRLAEKMMLKYNQKRPTVFTTIQCYRHDRLEYLKKLIEDAKEKNYFIGMKIVRGAYLEKENLRAKKMNYPTPMNPSKKATDQLFNDSVKLCLENIDKVWTCIGTHNEESCQLAVQLMEEKQISTSDQRVYFSQLLGMSDHISFNLSKEGYNVAKYLPYGPLQAVLPYLFRRAEENTSIKGQTGREFLLVNKEMERRKKIRKR